MRARSSALFDAASQLRGPRRRSPDAFLQKGPLMSKTVFLLILSLFAAVAPAAEKPEKVEVAIVTKAMDSEFWRTVREGAERFAETREDMHLIVIHPSRETDIERQIEILYDLAKWKVDAVAVTLCGMQEMIPALENLERSEIPFVIFDGDIDIDMPMKKAYVGSENYEGGALAGRYVAEHLPDGGSVAIITGVMGHGPHIARVMGFQNALARRPDIRVLSQQAANSLRTRGRAVMRNIIENHPRVDFVFATNDEMALGAAEVAHLLERRVGIVGFDGTRQARDAIRDGVISATVYSHSFDLGYETAKAAYMAAKGEPQPDYVPIEFSIITKDNLEDPSTAGGDTP